MHRALTTAEGQQYTKITHSYIAKAYRQLISKGGREVESDRVTHFPHLRPTPMPTLCL